MMNNVWSCTSIQHICLHGMDKDNLAFTLLGQWDIECSNIMAMRSLNNSQKHTHIYTCSISYCI
jgi:hypothetical protein